MFNVSLFYLNHELFWLPRPTIVISRVKEAGVSWTQVLSQVVCLGAGFLWAVVDRHSCTAVYGGAQRGGPEEASPCGAFSLLCSFLGHKLGH